MSVTAEPVQLRSCIAGQWIDGRETVLDLNPSRPDDVIAEVALADEAVARDAVAAAAAAFDGWRRTPAPQRGEILRRAGDLLDRRADEVGHGLAREEGKTVAEAVGETRRAAAILRYYAGQTLEPDGDTYPSHFSETLLYTRREPLGVVVAITPWNFPLAIPAWKIAPAIAYGNTVVWKPAELVPLTSVAFLQALDDAGLPRGVLNLVLGRGSQIGETIVSAPETAAVSFTGSNAVGDRLRVTAAAHSKKLQLELGGKNPAVVLADADLDFAAEQVARGAFLSAGQKCTATSRVIVEDAVLDDFLERLVARAETWVVGDALDEATQVGPLASQAQLDTVLSYLEVAGDEQGEMRAGGGRPEGLGGGYFVRPTVVTGLPAGSRVASEEIFGPVAAVLPAESYDHALALANDTPFGLTAALFTRDLSRALSFAESVRAGVVKINQESAGLEFHLPFGGTKGSSSGTREQGKTARDFYTEWKTVYVDYRE